MSAENNFKLTIPFPDDFHAHFRDGEITGVAVKHASERFARAVAMPNLMPAVKSVSEALAYRERLLEKRPEGSTWEPLMMLYLTKDLSVDEVKKAAETDSIIAVKYYPEGVTTNSCSGITDLSDCHDILAAMEDCGLTLSMHPETPDPEMDIFKIEADFLERTVADYLLKHFPSLPIALEHLTVKESAEFLLNSPKNVLGTVTPQHLLLTRDDLMKGGLKPHWFCYPVVKSSEDRAAIQQLVTSGFDRVCAGTDSAPHPRANKERAVANAGIYSHDCAVELYAEVFDSILGLDTPKGQEIFVNFMSHNGRKFYGLEQNPSQLSLVKQFQDIPSEYEWQGGELVSVRAGLATQWKIQG